MCTPGATVDALPGTYNILSCATVDFTDTGTVSLTGTMTIDDGASVTTAGLFRIFGTLNIDGNLDVTGNLGLVNNCTVTVSSTGYAHVGGDVFDGSPGGQSGNLILNGTMDVDGDFNLEGGGALSGTGYLTYGTFNDNGGSLSASFTDCADADGDCGDITLPVDLLYFNGRYEGEKVILSWSTATELNNDRFVIEKSLNGSNFFSIGSVTGFGTTNEIQEYSFEDESVTSSGYYRLTQVDFDGTEKIFDAIYISTERGLATPILVYPNPTNGKVYLTGDPYALYDWKLTDMSGKSILSSTEVTLYQSELFLSSVMPSLNKGVYVLRFNKEGHISSYSIVLK